MILSQVVRGAAEGAAGVGYELDAAGVAAVFRAAADAGYAAVGAGQHLNDVHGPGG
jgi:dihydroxyacetone kinase-like predicted kinase